MRLYSRPDCSSRSRGSVSIPWSSDMRLRRPNASRHGDLSGSAHTRSATRPRPISFELVSISTRFADGWVTPASIPPMYTRRSISIPRQRLWLRARRVTPGALDRHGSQRRVSRVFFVSSEPELFSASGRRRGTLLGGRGGGPTFAVGTLVPYPTGLAR